MSELQHIFKQIFSNHPEDIIDSFANSFTEKHLKKNEFFLNNGSVCRELAFIQKGAMMCYYMKDGKRYIDEFSLDYEFITDYASFLKQLPSDKAIICLNNSTIHSISFNKMKALYDSELIEFERLGRIMSEQLFFLWHEKSKSLLLDNATERYLKLIKNRPALLTRVPQYLIAEYLGITPESLSRIRNSLSKSN